jgi:hypothetical protein
LLLNPGAIAGVQRSQLVCETLGVALGQLKIVLAQGLRQVAFDRLGVGKCERVDRQTHAMHNRPHRGRYPIDCERRRRSRQGRRGETGGYERTYLPGSTALAAVEGVPDGEVQGRDGRGGRSGCFVFESPPQKLNLLVIRHG